MREGHGAKGRVPEAKPTFSPLTRPGGARINFRIFDDALGMVPEVSKSRQTNAVPGCSLEGAEADAFSSSGTGERTEKGARRL